MYTLRNYQKHKKEHTKMPPSKMTRFQGHKVTTICLHLCSQLVTTTKLTDDMMHMALYHMQSHNEATPNTTDTFEM